MVTGSIFEQNGTQAVKLHDDARFPKSVKLVNIRVVGFDRILSPVENTWDSFFLPEDTVTNDFAPDRSSQKQADRECF